MVIKKGSFFSRFSDPAEELIQAETSQFTNLAIWKWHQERRRIISTSPLSEIKDWIPKDRKYSQKTFPKCSPIGKMKKITLNKLDGKIWRKALLSGDKNI